MQYIKNVCIIKRDFYNVLNTILCANEGGGLTYLLLKLEVWVIKLKDDTGGEVGLTTYISKIPYFFLSKCLVNLFIVDNCEPFIPTLRSHLYIQCFKAQIVF